MASTRFIASGILLTAFAFWITDGWDAGARTLPAQQWVGVSLPSRVAAVGPEQAGVIVEMPMTEGMSVKRGDILFRLTSELESLEFARFEALSKSPAQVDKALVRVEQTKEEELLLLQLAKEKIVSEAELHKRKFASAIAQAEYAQAKLNQTLLSNRLEQARVRLEQRTVKSPLTGQVTKWLRQPGEPAARLEPVIHVASLHPLWIEFDCPIRNQHLFRFGSEVMVAPAQRPDEQRAAIIVFASMQATPSSHTFRVRLATPNPDRDWKAGLKMHVSLKVPHASPGGSPHKKHK